MQHFVCDLFVCVCVCSCVIATCSCVTAKFAVSVVYVRAETRDAYAFEESSGGEKGE